MIVVDVYRIVASKALESSSDPISGPSGGEKLTVTPSFDHAKEWEKNKCC